MASEYQKRLIKEQRARAEAGITMSNDPRTASTRKSSSSSGGSSSGSSSSPSPDLLQNATVGGKVYDNVTMDEVLSGKLSSNTQATLDAERTATRDQAVITDNLRTSISKKTSSGQTLTPQEQYFVITGENKASVDSVNRFLSKSGSSASNVKKAQDNVSNVYNYQEDAQTYQDAKKAQEMALNAPQQASKQTSTVQYSNNFGVRSVEKWAERLVSKQNTVAEFSKGYKQAVLGREDLGGLEIQPTDNAFQKTAKFLGQTGYAISIGLPETFANLFLTAEKTGFYALAGGVSLTNKGTREAFKESSAEQRAFALNSITFIDTQALASGQGFKYDPQGTSNILVASAFASIKASSTIKSKQLKPKENTIKPTKVDTVIDKKGNTITTERGTYVNQYGKTQTYAVKTTLDASGKGTSQIKVFSPKGKTIYSKSAKVNQDATIVKQPGNILKVDTKTTVKPKGQAKTVETFKGQGKQSVIKLDEGTGKGLVGQELKGSIKTTGKTRSAGSLEKSSLLKVEGSIKTTSEFKQVSQGQVGRFEIKTKTFTPSKTSEFGIKQKTTLNPSFADKVSSGISKVGEFDGKIYSFTEPISPTIRAFGQFTEGFSGNVPAPISPLSPSLNVPGITPTPSPSVYPSSSLILNSLTPTPSFVVPIGQFGTSQQNGEVSQNIPQLNVGLPSKPSLNIKPISQQLEETQLDAPSLPSSNPIVQGTSKPRSSTKPITNVNYGATEIVDYGSEPNTISQPDFQIQGTNENLSVPFTFSSVRIEPQLPIPLILPKAVVFPKRFDSNQGQGFNVFTKKRGQITKLNTKPLTEEEATNLGTFVVGSTARASLRVTKTKESIGQRFSGRGQRSDFKQSKRGWLVEKTSARINTPGELKEITLKGISSNKNKKSRKKKKGSSIFGGVFKL